MIEISKKDKIYPEKLKNIKDPPKKLYAEGNIELLNQNIIAIIGSRKCSENGKKLARKFAKELSYQGLTIASGMAIGIDTAAHTATLESNGKTIAVLGSGFEHIFPEENTELYHEIIKSGGLIISEYPPKTKPSSNKFLERNRIISGLSIGILVVEAEHRSGTSVTARIAKTQNRRVFVLPHEIDDKHGIGTNKLIRNGATLVTSTKDIIDEFNFLTYKEIIETKENSQNKANKEENENNLEKNKRNVEIKDQEHKKIYNLIKNGTQEINELARKTNKTISEVTSILLMLEIEKYIKKKKEVINVYKPRIRKVGEDLACKYLIQNNYKIIERNFRCRQGEIDIIAYDRNAKELVFFEVKTRSSFKYGRPSEAVTKVKKKHIVKAAEYYYHYKNRTDGPLRFDVIEVVFYKGKGMLNHIQKAILYES